jgi:hypothetical protein
MKSAAPRKRRQSDRQRRAEELVESASESMKLAASLMKEMTKRRGRSSFQRPPISYEKFP